MKTLTKKPPAQLLYGVLAGIAWVVMMSVSQRFHNLYVQLAVALAGLAGFVVAVRGVFRKRPK